MSVLHHFGVHCSMLWGCLGFDFAGDASLPPKLHRHLRVCSAFCRSRGQHLHPRPACQHPLPRLLNTKRDPEPIDGSEMGEAGSEPDRPLDRSNPSLFGHRNHRPKRFCILLGGIQRPRRPLPSNENSVPPQIQQSHRLNCQLLCSQSCLSRNQHQFVFVFLRWG